MEILSDATFKGNVSINGGDFSVTRKGDNNPVIKTVPCGALINGSARIAGGACISGDTYIGGLLEIDGTEILHGTLDVRGDIDIDGMANFCSVTNFCETVNFYGCCVAIIGGALALGSNSISDWNALNNFLSFAKLKTFTSPSIPANCTAFEFTGTAISDTNKTHMIQVQNTSTGKSVIAETWMTTNKKPAMSFAGCTSTIAAGTYTAMVI